jgi:enoyl-CoA hydratase/carnithine racemase
MARYEIRMTFKNLLVERDEPVALVTFNRPKVLNALNSETLDEFSQVLRELRDDATIRCVVLTGAGEKAFVAGADIKELAVQTPVNTTHRIVASSLNSRKTWLNSSRVSLFKALSTFGRLKVTKATGSSRSTSKFLKVIRIS